MINTADFIKRLQKIIDYYGESASSFAEKVGVQRSSISHILSGRNKPSLDFVLKILSTYPEVDLYWLFNGKGDFPSKETLSLKSVIKEDTLFPPEKEHINIQATHHDNKSIERIVIFYSDGTFKNYKN